MSRAGSWMSALAVLLLATGCAGTQTREQEQRLQQAAKYNVQLGVSYMRSGELKLANDKLEKALRQAPDMAEAHNAYAILQERLGQYDKAEKHYRRAVALDPEDSEAHTNFGAFLCQRGRYEEAEEEFRRALDNPLNPRPEAALTQAGSCALRIPDRDKAERYFRRALERNPEFLPALLEMAKLSYAQRRHLQTRAFLQRYEAVLEKAARRNPQLPTTTPQVLWLCIQTERGLGNGPAAEACAQRLRREFPDSREAKLLKESEVDGVRG